LIDVLVASDKTKKKCCVNQC